MYKISLDELNFAVNECNRRMEGASFINYHFLEYASQEVTKLAKFEKKPVYLKFYSHEQAISMVLDFFKSLGNNASIGIIYSSM